MDIFQFELNTEYVFTMIDGSSLRGAVVATFKNGLALDDGSHIVQDKICYFKQLYTIRN